MDRAYPFNLVLAVATAAATIFLGFLPTRDIPCSFFARQTLAAALLWCVVAVGSPAGIMHYHVIIAILCGGAWWKFRRDNALSGKMWLSIGSGLGISIGVMLILAVTPAANPPGQPQLDQSLLLASIYLGGIVVGLAYVCYLLAANVNVASSGISITLVRRYTGLLLALALARAAVLLVNFFLRPGHYRSKTTWYPDGPAQPHSSFALYATDTSVHFQDLALLALGVVLLPLLALAAQRATRLHSRFLPLRPLAALIFLGLLTEALARLCVL